MRYEKIEINSTSYEDSLRLRYEVLRKPLDLEISQQQYRSERSSNYYHFAAFQGETLISALSTCVNEQVNIQICQIATHPDYQRKGIGRALLFYAEKSLLKSIALADFFVFSRKNVIEFYLKCNYRPCSNEIYNIVGLDHIRMSKKLYAKAIGCADERSTSLSCRSHAPRGND